jgi:hypothetical protein
MGQTNPDELFESFEPADKNVKVIGNSLYIKFKEDNPEYVSLYNRDVLVKTADLSDKFAKKLFVTDAIELGANKSQLARALGISRQTIHNYEEMKKYFGIEGLANGYNPEKSKNLKKQRKEHAEQLPRGNKARQLEDIRKAEREKLANQLQPLPFGDQTDKVSPQEQPFSEEHDWEPTRYAGTFPYLITLINKNQWLDLLFCFFGDKYKIFMVFLLMASQDIRSIEQLKNIFKRESGLLIGIKRVPSKAKIWEWFYAVANMNCGVQLHYEFFRQQIRSGNVGLWLWFTDGHLLPYTGSQCVHKGYNTQRRLPVPGRTNMVTSDLSGRVVDFEIQEGKGNLRKYIISLGKKWEEVSDKPVMVFDREGYGAEFFYNMVENKIGFVTWQKHIDAKELEKIDEEQFNEKFEVNNKKYRIFEGKKEFTHKIDGKEKKVTLRQIFIRNVTSNRKTCALSGESEERLSTKECAIAILNRWGASENTFKHLAQRHPLDYQPGFKFEKSEKQDVANPERKEKQNLLKRLKKGLNKLFKKFSKTKEIRNKNGSVRKNSQHENLKHEIQKQEMEIKELEQELKQLPERVDASGLQDYKCFNRISDDGKILFDFVTSSVFNASKQMTQWLLPFYNNQNEYIDLFYTITQCHGWIKSEKHTVTVRLEQLEQPGRRAAQEQFCRKLSSLGAMTPNGKVLKIEAGPSPLG